ncbi:MAG: hypothetical protein ABFC83_00065 [Synergistaceae bacterium]
MSFTHKAGEKMFVDFSGDKVRDQDPATEAVSQSLPGSTKKRSSLTKVQG